MALDIDALVAPLTDEEPSGPDLYADSERQIIEQAFERSISEGESSGEAVEVDWRDIIARIEAQAERTRDLWLPTYLMRAAAHQGNFAKLVEGAEFLARLTEERWADVHPQLEELGFIGRKTPCEPLTRLGEFLNPLSAVPVLKHERLGSYSTADFERFADGGGNAEGYGMFRALIDETPVDDLKAVVEQLDALADSIRRTDTVMTDNAEGDTATNFEPTYKVIRQARAAVSSFLPEEVVEPAPGDSFGGSQGGVSVGAANASGPAFSGSITSRDDVVRAIDSICAYYSRYEPGSPVPFALRRAKDWISLDFMAVLEDIAPGGVAEAGQILKSKIASGGGSDSSWGSDDSWGSGESSQSSGSEESSSDDGW